jgi:hypothetical protein
MPKAGSQSAARRGPSPPNHREGCNVGFASAAVTGCVSNRTDQGWAQLGASIPLLRPNAIDGDPGNRDSNVPSGWMHGCASLAAREVHQRPLEAQRGIHPLIARFPRPGVHRRVARSALSVASALVARRKRAHAAVHGHARCREHRTGLQAIGNVLGHASGGFIRL